MQVWTNTVIPIEHAEYMEGRGQGQAGHLGPSDKGCQYQEADWRFNGLGGAWGILSRELSKPAKNNISPTPKARGCFLNLCALSQQTHIETQASVQSYQKVALL